MGSLLPLEAACYTCQCPWHWWPAHFTSTHPAAYPHQSLLCATLAASQSRLHFLHATHAQIPYSKMFCSFSPFWWLCLNVINVLMSRNGANSLQIFFHTHWFTNSPGISMPGDLKWRLLKCFVQSLKVLCLPLTRSFLFPHTTVTSAQSTDLESW